MTQRYSRAQRRADYARLKNKRRNHWGYGNQGWRSYCEHERGSLYEMPPEVAGTVANTPAACSCYMCGNPRKNSWADNPLTMQEQKAAHDYEAQLEDYFEWYGDWCDGFYWDEYDDDWDFSEEDPVTDWYLKGLYIKG